MTDAPRAGTPADAAVGTAGFSLADWTAGYEAGYAAGYRAARTVLDEAARAVAALRPSRSVAIATARTADAPAADEPDRSDPTAVAAYRARIYASWGLPPPDEATATKTSAGEAESTSATPYGLHRG